MKTIDVRKRDEYGRYVAFSLTTNPKLEAVERQMTAQEKFWRRTVKAVDCDCVLWNRCKDDKGYGRAKWNGKMVLAHRLAYTLSRGPIPPGLTIDHLCRNRACVNPDHLEPVTIKENILRSESPCAQNKRKTVCKRGHPLEGENLYVSARGGRECRVCRSLKRPEHKSNARRARLGASSKENKQ